MIWHVQLAGSANHTIQRKIYFKKGVKRTDPLSFSEYPFNGNNRAPLTPSFWLVSCFLFLLFQSASSGFKFSEFNLMFWFNLVCLLLFLWCAGSIVSVTAIFCFSAAPCFDCFVVMLLSLFRMSSNILSFIWCQITYVFYIWNL